jgi:hypothetical protein
MKNLIVMAIMTIFFVGSMSTFAATGYETLERKASLEKGDRVGGSIVITFGHGKHCVLRGICSIEIRASFNPTEAAKISYNEENNGTLTIDIPSEYLRTYQSEKLNLFVGQTQFVVEEDYKLSKEVCKALGTSENLVIKAGTYGLSFKDGIYKLIIGDML